MAQCQQQTMNGDVAKIENRIVQRSQWSATKDPSQRGLRAPQDDDNLQDISELEHLRSDGFPQDHLAPMKHYHEAAR